MMTDPISDMLTRIRNAAMAGLRNVEMPMSNIKMSIAKILASEGYLAHVELFNEGTRPMLRVVLKYDEAGSPVVHSLKRVSKPGRRVYVKASDLGAVRSGFGLAILSTPNGLMTAGEARKRRLGGELICEVF